MNSFFDNEPGAIKRREMAFLFFISFLVFFGFGSFNVFNSFENNWSVFLFEVVFVISSFLLVRGGGWPDKKVVFFVLVIVSGVLLANCISSLSGSALSDLKRTVSFCFHFVFFLAFLRVMGVYRGALWAGLLGVLLAALFAVFLIALAWVRMPFPESYNWVTGLENFRNIRHLGYLLAVSVVASAWVYWRASKLALLMWPFFVLLFSALLWTGGRAAIVAGFMGVLFCFLANSFSEHKMKWLFFLLAVFLAAPFAEHFSVQNSLMGLGRVVSSENIASNVNEVSSGRVDMWLHVASLIAEKPFFGWGGEAYYSLRDGPGYVQAHNGILQLLLEWGMFVALFVFGAMTYLYLSACYFLIVCGRKAGGGLVLGVSMVTVLLALSMLDGVFYHGMPSAILSFSFAVLLFYRDEAKKQANVISQIA